MPSRREFALTCAILLGIAFLLPVPASAHCDGLDGPVVKAAQKTLETGNVSFALVWVQQKDEPEIAGAFEKTLAVRRLGPEAKALADHYFYETLVRVHRAGEGEPYTGLKPEGRDLGPAIPAADRAIETGSPAPLAGLLTSTTRAGIEERLRAVLDAKRAVTMDDVSAGRRFVAVYVTFIHYIERLYEASTTPAEGHFPEAGNHKQE